MSPVVMKGKHLYKAFGDLNENEDFTTGVYLWAAQTLLNHFPVSTISVQFSWNLLP